MGLRRLVEIGLLERVARGVYLNRAEPPGRDGVWPLFRHLRPDGIAMLVDPFAHGSDWHYRVTCLMFPVSLQVTQACRAQPLMSSK